jgi:hypothetical protein
VKKPFCLALIICVALVATAGAQTKPGLQTYKHTRHKFTLQYPKTLKRNPAAKAPAVVMLQEVKNDEFTLNHVQVIVTDVKPGVTLDLLVEQLVASAKKRGSGEAKVEDATVAGKPAKRLTYTMPSSGNTFNFRQTVCIANNKAFVLTIASTPEDAQAFLPVAQSVVDSFAWME